MKTKSCLVAISVFVSLLYFTAFIPETLAQSAFTGVVRDQSGAVLPGVSVEAASPALIEKSRSTVSDERGTYKIIDLRPGNYSLTFTLPGFKTVTREVELPSDFTATINAEMTVGAVEETITVAAESPVVDSKTNFKAQVLPREVLDRVPTAHTIQSAGQLVVGVQMDVPDVGGSRAMQQTYFFVHGAGTSQTSVLMDGMIINGLQADGAVQSYMNDAGAEQMVFQTGGGTADSPTGGLKLNVAPKEGGNSFHGSLFAGFESNSLQSNNLSPSLASHGVRAVDQIGTYRDIDVTLGGPVIKDKLWFFGSSRFFTVNKPVANSFYIPAGRTYTDCRDAVVACQQAINDQSLNSVLLRLTWRVSSRNKLSVYMDRLIKTRYHDVTAAAASYVRGGHNVKFGFQNSWGPFNRTAWANADLYQNYLNGVPATVTLLGTPARWKERLNAGLAIYGQDAWTLGRITITYGLRWGYISEQVSGQPAQHGRFANIPAFGDIHMPIWRTWSPRTAVVYDLFGNAKTAIRFGFNRFDAAATTNIAELYDPANAGYVQATAAWTNLANDDIAHGEPGCVYLTPGCEINFAQVPKNFGKVSLSNPDPNLKLPYTLAYNLGVTHELFPGVAVTAEWFHSVAKNILERNNTLRPGTMTGSSSVSNANYIPVTVFSPIDGRAITMYDPISTAVQQSVANVDTNDPNLSNVYNGFEFNFNARLPRGGRLFGGTSTDRSIANACSAAKTNPNFLQFCDQSKNGIPWRTQFKLVGTYPLPWWGLQLSSSLQALPGYAEYYYFNNLLTTPLQPLLQGGGTVLDSILNQPNGLSTVFTVTPTTRYTACPGNSAAAGFAVGALVIPGMIQPSLNVPLIAPGTELTPRLNQVDFSVSKRLAFERIRLEPRIDLFNALNSSDYYQVQSMVYSTASGAAYKRPSAILLGRLLRFGFNLEF